MLICNCKQQLRLAKINHVIYFSQSQLLLAKTNEDRTTNRKAPLFVTPLVPRQSCELSSTSDWKNKNRSDVSSCPRNGRPSASWVPPWNPYNSATLWLRVVHGEMCPLIAPIDASFPDKRCELSQYQAIITRSCYLLLAITPAYRGTNWRSVPGKKCNNNKFKIPYYDNRNRWQDLILESRRFYKWRRTCVLKPV